jgi:hypothetical protein
MLFYTLIREKATIKYGNYLKTIKSFMKEKNNLRKSLALSLSLC